jgi:hypothetical protein
MPSIVRYPAALAQFGNVSQDFFDANYVLQTEDQPFVSGTENVPRLRKVYLGPKTVGFYSVALDRLVEALVALAAKLPLPPLKPGGAVAIEFHSTRHRKSKRSGKRTSKLRAPTSSRRVNSEAKLGR